MNKRVMAFAWSIMLTVLVFAGTAFAGWITPQADNEQAEVGKLYNMEYSTGVWHNRQQYCDLAVTDGDGNQVYFETFKFDGIGVRIKGSFIPSKTGQYTLSARCYYEIVNTTTNFATGFTSSYTTYTTDSTHTVTLNVVEKIKEAASEPGEANVNDLGLVVVDDTIIITSLKDKTATAMTIPVTIQYGGKDMPVTAIAPNAFKGMKNLKSIVIGKNVKKIGANAFRGCKNLKKITFKTNKLKKNSIGANAFKGINAKAQIKCPKAKKAAYKKILLKKGMKKTMTFK